MSKQLYIGIDFGTTVLKLCAVNGATRKVRGKTERRLSVRVLPNGGREQRLAPVDRAFSECAAELRDALGADWASVAGIGVAAQGGSSILAERETGKPFTPMILWNDGRSQGRLAELAESRPASYWRKYVARDIPPAGLARLAMLQENHADLFRPECIHIGAGEYLFHRLTGVWRQDPGNAIQIGSYNAVRQELDPTLLELVDVPLDFVAPLRQGHETAALDKRGARLLGLPQGIPVAGPYIDQEAAYMSAAAAAERPLQCSLGTSWVGNFSIPREHAGSSPFQFVLPSPVDEGSLVIQPLLCGNLAWDWALDHLLAPNKSEQFSLAEKLFKNRLLPPKGLYALPWWTQPNPLEPEAHGGGAILGVNPETGCDDLVRAVAVGMACELARVFHAIKDARIIRHVVVSGGAARGSYFRKLIAALFHPIPVLSQADADIAAARGALYAFDARLAATGTQRIDSNKAGRRTEAIREYFTGYCRTLDALYGHIPAGKPYQLNGGD